MVEWGLSPASTFPSRCVGLQVSPFWFAIDCKEARLVCELGSRAIARSGNDNPRNLEDWSGESGESGALHSIYHLHTLLKVEIHNHDQS
jgi:hypothetical protein